MKTLETIKITSKDTEDKLNQLSKKLFDKDLSALSAHQKTDLVCLDLGMMMQTITVSCDEKRTTEIKFNTNGYFAAATISLEAAKSYITSVLEGLSEETMLDRYFELKSLFYNMARIKWEGHEHYLRGLLRSAQEQDSIDCIGRFNTN